MDITLTHQDIESRLCRRCAACCRITLNIKNTDSRYRVFLRTLDFAVHPPVKDGDPDCCEKVHDIKIDTGWCKHLEIGEDSHGKLYGCRLYGQAHYPRLCKEYDCVSWAHHDNTYHDGNALLKTAQMAFDALRAAGKR